MTRRTPPEEVQAQPAQTNDNNPVYRFNLVRVLKCYLIYTGVVAMVCWNSPHAISGSISTNF